MMKKTRRNRVKKVVTVILAMSMVALLIIGCEGTSPVSIKWTYNTDTGCNIYHYFEIVDDVLYTSYSDGNLYAIDRHTGMLKWQYHDEEGRFTKCSVVGDVIYLGRFGRKSSDRSEMNYLYAVDRKNGELMWHYNLGGNEVLYCQRCYEAKPLIAHNVVYIISPAYNLYSIDMNSHESLWRFSTELDEDFIFSISSVTNGMVYFFTRELFYAVDTTSGETKLQWEDIGELKSRMWVSTATVTDSIAYIGVNFIDAEKSYLYAIDSISGEFKWKYETGWVSFPPIDVDGVIIFGSRDDYLYALDADTGQLFWKCKMRDRVMSSPAVSNDIVYVGCRDNKLYAVDVNSGELLWRFKTGGPVYSSIIVEDNIIYFGSSDGYLYAMEISGDSQQ